MLSTCNNCKETIRPDEEAFNGYVHIATDSDSCETISTARATLGAYATEPAEGDGFQVFGTTNTGEAVELLNRYRQALHGDGIDDINVEAYELTKVFARVSLDPDADTVKMLIIPGAIDLDGHEPVIIFGTR